MKRVVNTCLTRGWRTPLAGCWPRSAADGRRRGAAVLDTLSARVLYGVDDPNRSAGVTGALFRTAV